MYRCCGFGYIAYDYIKWENKHLKGEAMDYKNVPVMKKDELQNGQMKTVKIDQNEILIVRVKNGFHAFAAHCTHYGATLSEGVLSGDRIVCPWHHACFHARSGDLLEPPARDALPRYEVSIEGEEVIVKFPEKPEAARIPDMTGHQEDKDKRIFLILGAGAAGNAAAQSLRENGFAGRILMITRENRLPYDRPNLSKDYLQGEADPEWMPLRPEEFYKTHGIELLQDRVFERVNIPTSSVTFSDGDTLIYDKLLIASGGIPRKLPVAGAELENAFILRSFDDSDAIIKALEGAKEAVIIGSSFIGMETASSLIHRGLKVTVVSRDQLPFVNVFGPEIGKLFKDTHEKNGVRFKLNSEVKEFAGKDALKEVILKNGERLKADLVIVGIGVKPATDFVQGLKKNSDGGIIVDQNLKASENVYAAGDIVSFPFWLTGKNVRIEHWRTSEQLGRIAAINMAGKETPYMGIPFFWTNQAGFNFRYVGYAPVWDEIIIKGNVSARDFLAYFVRENIVVAVGGMNRDKDIAAAEELLRLKKMPSPAQIKNSDIKLVEIFGR
jgi:NADPH-dependent 2,4-dienoyl-CoA reductase/sulfur reductase-like enzyme/nitrite reductase/ring-hydroxylating ferredoxin subunit